jgi:hypothetical protein
MDTENDLQEPLEKDEGNLFRGIFWTFIILSFLYFIIRIIFS